MIISLTVNKNSLTVNINSSTVNINSLTVKKGCETGEKRNRSRNSKKQPSKGTSGTEK